MPLDPLAGLRSRAFNSPADDYLSGGFRNASGSSYRTGFQDDVDEGVQDDINRRHLKSLAAIEAADKLRGDPMADQIEARKKNLAYERLLPSGSKHSLRFGMEPGKGANVDLTDVSTPIGKSTIGEDVDLFEAYEKSRAKSAADIATEGAKGEAKFAPLDKFEDEMFERSAMDILNGPEPEQEKRAAIEELRRKHLTEKSRRRLLSTSGYPRDTLNLQPITGTTTGG